MKRIIALVLLLFLTGCSAGKICINNDCYAVEIADTAEKRSTGLMNREILDSGKGMWFVFPEERGHSIWMKNTLIPLDVIWVGSDYRINHIESLEPCTSEPCPSYVAEGKYVLEINKGLASSYNIGDYVKIK